MTGPECEEELSKFRDHIVIFCDKERRLPTERERRLFDAIQFALRVFEAVRDHRAQRADDRCIEDDDALYAALEDGIKCDRRVGDKDAMLENCRRFVSQRCEGGGPWKSYRELEQEVEMLKAKLLAVGQ